MKFFAFSVQPLSVQERAAYARLAGVPASALVTEDGERAAVRSAIRATEAQGTLIGRLQDVRPKGKPDGYSDVEWRLAWLDYLEARGVCFIPVPGKDPALPEGDGSAASVVRRYQRAARDLAKQLAEEATDDRRRAGCVLGRPPYGYQSAGGRLTRHPRQSKLVRHIFSALRKGDTVADILLTLPSDEFWDRVKIRRILTHAPLYCRGALATRAGIVVRSELAFLPAAWEKWGRPTRDTTVPRHPEAGTLG